MSSLKNIVTPILDRQFDQLQKTSSLLQNMGMA